MADQQTVDVYDAKVADYVTVIKRTGIDPDLDRFMRHLQKDGFVLDLGCGPAFASVVMRGQGFKVDPVDASAEMVNFANTNFDIGARIATFDEIKGEAIYDGIWANFSLLHAPRLSMRGHLAALKKALKPRGMFHIGVKLGDGEARDKLGRFYTYYGEGELSDLLEETGFHIIAKSHGNEPGLSGEAAPWVTILSLAIASKPEQA